MAVPSSTCFGPIIVDDCTPAHQGQVVGLAGPWHFYWKAPAVLQWKYGTQVVVALDTTYQKQVSCLGHAKDNTASKDDCQPACLDKNPHQLVSIASDAEFGNSTGYRIRESTAGSTYLLEGTQRVLMQGQQLHVGDNSVVFEGKRGPGTVTCAEVHIGSATASPSVYVNGVLWPATNGTAGQLLSTDGSGQLQWISGGSASGSTFDSLTVDGWTLDMDTPTTDWTLAPPGSTTPVVRVSTAGQITAQSVATTSDRSLKTNVCTLNAGQATPLLQQLEPVRFTWKSTGQSAYGFIAQDVERVEPQLVQAQQPDGLRSIKTLELVPLLVAEVQDLRRQLQELRASLA